MANMIHNAVVQISKRDLVTCKRCGCPDLAWVRFKSGKSALVQTAVQRPMWAGEWPAPVGLFALKFNYHRCDEHKAQKDAIDNARRLAEIREGLCHPKAENPGAILSDALVYLFRMDPHGFQDTASATFLAAEILGQAATNLGADARLTQGRT